MRITELLIETDKQCKTCIRVYTDGRSREIDQFVLDSRLYSNDNRIVPYVENERCALASFTDLIYAMF